MLNTLMLARSGLSDGFLFAPYREHCASKMFPELYEVDFEERFARSIVSDLGILDVGSYIQDIRYSAGVGFTISQAVKMWALCKLEAVLRTYLE